MSEFDKIKDTLIGLINGLQAQTTLNRLGLAGARLIRKRTREGKFLPGSSPGHQTYSEGHKKRREKLGLPTGRVNLQMNTIDGMMNSIDHVIGRKLEDVELVFTDPEKAEIASYHNELGAGKNKVKRVFFDFNQKEDQMLTDLVGKDIANHLRKLTRRAN